MKSLVVALVLIVPALSQAETALYKGEFDHRTITVRFEVKLPSGVQMTPGGEYNDPEMGPVQVPATFQAEVGTITVSYRGETTTLAEDLLGEDRASGIWLGDITRFEPKQDSLGQVSEGLDLNFDGMTNASQMRIKLNSAHTQVTHIEFPAEFTTHAIYYQDDAAVAGDYVRFVRQ